MDKESDFSHITDPNAVLERALIEDFIRSQGQDPSRLRDLPEDERRRLESAASRHAAARLAEMEARALYVHDLHGHR
jgi:hypothetical protein